MRRYLKRLIQLCGCYVILAASPVHSAPVISELFYDASGTDTGLAFVELFGVPGESLEGMILEGVNGTGGVVYSSISLSGVMPGDGVFVIGDDNAGMTSVPGADLIADVDYQNGPDSVVLRTDTLVLDAVGYGDFGLGDVFAGEGGAAPDPASGSSIARFNPVLDSDDNSFDFIALSTPTPGSVPVVTAVPLPAGLWLFISGLIPILSSAAKRRIRITEATG